MIIYLVCGESGEYDDWQRWNVKGFTRKADAEAHAAKLSREAILKKIARDRAGNDVRNMEGNVYRSYSYRQMNEYRILRIEHYMRIITEEYANGKDLPDFSKDFYVAKFDIEEIVVD